MCQAVQTVAKAWASSARLAREHDAPGEAGLRALPLSSATEPLSLVTSQPAAKGFHHIWLQVQG